MKNILGIVEAMTVAAEINSIKFSRIVDAIVTVEGRHWDALIVKGVRCTGEKASFTIAWDDALSDRKRFYTADPFGDRIEFIQTGDGFTER